MRAVDGQVALVLGFVMASERVTIAVAATAVGAGRKGKREG